jgi:hypothetical protein
VTKVNHYTKTREDALEVLYSVAVRIASLRLNPYANQWYIERALEELEIFALEVQRHGTQEGRKATNGSA